MTDGSTTATAHLARAIEAVAEAVERIADKMDTPAFGSARPDAPIRAALLKARTALVPVMEVDGASVAATGRAAERMRAALERARAVLGEATTEEPPEAGKAESLPSDLLEELDGLLYLTRNDITQIDAAQEAARYRATVRLRQQSLYGLPARMGIAGGYVFGAATLDGDESTIDAKAGAMVAEEIFLAMWRELRFIARATPTPAEIASGAGQ